MLRSNTTLKTLKLPGASFDVEAAKAMSVAFTTNTTLTDLDLSGNHAVHMSDEWTGLIAGAVRAHRGLARAKLDGETLAVDELRRRPWTAQPFPGRLSTEAIQQLVAGNSSLQDLSLKATASARPMQR